MSANSHYDTALRTDTLADADAVINYIVKWIADNSAKFNDILTDAERDFAYVGFNARNMLMLINAKIGQMEGFHKIVIDLIVLVLMRGTQHDKIKNKLDTIGKEKLQQLSNLIGIDWSATKNTITPTTVTPGRFLLCFPEVVMMACCKLPARMLGSFPWPFRHTCIAAFLKKHGDEKYKACALAASYAAAYTINRGQYRAKPSLHRLLDTATLVTHCWTYLELGFESNVVPDDRRKLFIKNSVQPLHNEITAQVDDFYKNTIFPHWRPSMEVVPWSKVVSKPVWEDCHPSATAPP